MQDFISRTIVDRPVLSKYSFGNWFNMVNYITLFTLQSVFLRISLINHDKDHAL